MTLTVEEIIGDTLDKEEENNLSFFIWKNYFLTVLRFEAKTSTNDYFGTTREIIADGTIYHIRIKTEKTVEEAYVKTDVIGLTKIYFFFRKKSKLSRQFFATEDHISYFEDILWKF